MAAEIVGTAYIRLRAISTQLASDIQDGLDKGAKDAKLDKAGEKLGTDLSAGIGDGVEAGVPDVVDKIDDSLEKEGGKRTEKRGNWLGRKISKGMGDGIDKDNSFLKSFQGKLKKLEGLTDKLKLPGIAWTGLIGVSLLNSVVAVAGAILGTLVAQLGYVATAAAGAGAAIIGAVGSLAFAAVPIALAFKAETPQLAEFQEFAKAVSQEWAAVGKATQKFLLPGLTAAIGLSRRLIPVFEIFGTEVGRIVGDFAEFTVAVLTSERNTGPWAKVLMTSADVLQSLGGAITFLLDGALSFLSAASPIAIQFADSIENVAQKFNEMVRAGEASGALQETLQKFYDRAKLIFGALSDVAVALWNVFKIGADTAQPFFDTLSATAEKWKLFTQSPEGIEKIKTVFENMQSVMKEVNLLLKEIIGYILEPALTGDTGGMVSFLKVVRTELLPVFKELADTLSGTITDNLVTFTTEFAKLVQVGAESGALGALFGTLTTAMKILTELVSIPGVGEFVAVILTLAGGFKAFMMVFGPLIKILGPIVGWIARLAGLGGGLSGIVSALAAAAGGATTWGAAIAAIAAPIATFIAIVAAVIGAIVGVVYAFRNWDKITEWVSKAWDAVVDFVTHLPERLSQAGQWLWRWIQDAIPIALEWLGNLAQTIWDFLWDLPNKLVSALGAAGSMLWGWIQEAIPVVGSWLADFLETVGKFLIQLPFKILEWIGRAAVALFSWIADAIPYVLTHLDDWALAIGKFLLAVPAMILHWLAVAAEAMWSWIVNSGPGVLAKLGEWALAIGQWLLTLPGKILGWLAEAGKGLWQWIVDTAPVVLEKLGHLLGFIIGWAASLPGKILGLLASAGKALWDWIVKSGPTVLLKLASLTQTVGSFLLSLPGKILGWLGGAIVSLWQWIVDAVPIILEKLAYAIGFVAGFLLSLPGKILGWLASAAGALWGWIVEAVPLAIEKLAEFTQSVWDWVTNFIAEIPGRLLGAIEAMWNWIKEAVPLAVAKLGEFALGVWNWITNFISELPGRIASAAEALYNWIKDAVTEVPGKLADFAQKIWDWVTEFTSSLPDRFADAIDSMLGIGEDIVRGLWDGIKDMAGWIKDKVLGFAGDVLGGFAEGFGVFSPSRKMMVIGGYLSEGLAIGIEDMVSRVDRATEKLAAAATPDLSQLKTNYSVNVGTSLAPLDLSQARVAGQALTTAPAAQAAATIEAAKAAAIAAVQETNLSLLVKIGDRDITDIIDTQVSENDFAAAQAIYRTTKG
jgi:hypothetical protein